MPADYLLTTVYSPLRMCKTIMGDTREKYFAHYISRNIEGGFRSNCVLNAVFRSAVTIRKIRGRETEGERKRERE